MDTPLMAIQHFLGIRRPEVILHVIVYINTDNTR